MSNKHTKRPVALISQEASSCPNNKDLSKQDHSRVPRPFLSENLKKLAVAIVTGAIGTVGFWLSPLRDIVTHLIWHEKAVILLTTDSQKILEGSSLQVHITIIPQSAIHVDKGVVTIKFDSQLLRLPAGQTTFDSPQIESPMILPEGHPIEFIAVKSGTADIQVQLQTRNGIYSGKSNVEIQPAEITGEATRANFTGTWTLHIGGLQGKMQIRQQGRVSISGNYFLDNGDKGVIDGGRDGEHFWASFTRGASITKWMVETAKITETADNYLELEGVAYLQTASQNGWAKSGQDLNFYATVAVR